MSIQLQSRPTTSTRITSPYGWRIHPVTGKRTMHYGVDIGAVRAGVAGDPVTAVLPGTVSASYYNKYRGWVVLVDHGGRFATLYQHLREQGAAKGTRVSAGQVIGRMGATGQGVGVHLHFEVRIGGGPVDPAPYLANIAPATVPEEEANKVKEEYKTLAEVPQYFRPIVEWMMEQGVVAGRAPDNLGLTYDDCRYIVWLYRAILVAKGKVVVS